jgi:putative transposase
MSKAAENAASTREIIRSFKRNDVRIRKRLASKYGKRRRERARQLLNQVSKKIVLDARRDKQAIAFEDITGIRKLYRKGNGQGKSFRARMNSWPFFELMRQVQYKAAWEGVPVITLTKGETGGTTRDCPRCGERLQSAGRGDSLRYRQLWCEVCEGWIDRDVAAIMNISRRAWLRFSHASGGAGEAVKGNPMLPVILRVVASKLTRPTRS